MGVALIACYVFIVVIRWKVLCSLMVGALATLRKLILWEVRRVFE